MARVQALAEGALFLIPLLYVVLVGHQQEIMPDMKTTHLQKRMLKREQYKGSAS